MAGAPLGRVDRYELLTKIGQGSFGGVYRARHVHTGQLVALKLAIAEVDPDAARRILAEGRAAASLRHANVVGVLDGGISDKGEAFVVMELLEGTTLADVIEQVAPLPVPRACAIALQMLDGVIAAHEAGVIHRDIKPSNVFVSPGDAVKVIDFGISKLRRDVTGHAVLTMPGIAMGTPGYMAPEQLGDASSVDARADIYSVGATIYECLSKRRPIEADAFEVWMQRLERENAAPLASVTRGVPPAVAAVIDRAVARDRDARWPSARAMRDALAAAARGESAPLAPVARATSPSPLPTSALEGSSLRSVLPWAFAASGIVVAVVAIAFVVALAGRRGLAVEPAPKSAPKAVTPRVR